MVEVEGLPDVVEADEFQVFAAHGAFTFCAGDAGREVVVAGDGLHGGKELVDLGAGEIGVVGFAQGFDVDAGLGGVQLLDGGDDLFAADGRAVDVTAQDGRDGLLDGIEQLWSFFDGDLLDG